MQTNCKNCNAQVITKFCPDCGLPTTLKRIDFHYIQHELEHILHIEKGFLYTIKELLIRPGKTVKQFLYEDRNRLVKPVMFVILTSLILAFFSDYFHFNQLAKTNTNAPIQINLGQNSNSYIDKIFHWWENHQGYMFLLIIPFLSIGIKQFFKKTSYNFFELYILFCYAIGIANIIFLFAGCIEAISHFKTIIIGGRIGIAYLFWVVFNFLGYSFKNFFKIILSIVLSFTIFIALTLVIGGLLDYFFN